MEKKKENKTERKVAISPEGWQKIVTFLYETPLSFDRAEKATELNKIIQEAMMIDVTINESE